MMYKTPTFAEPQQYNRPFSTGQLSAFIIQLVTWQVLPRSEWKVQGRRQIIIYKTLYRKTCRTTGQIILIPSQPVFDMTR
jgi:hypothetical protein